MSSMSGGVKPGWMGRWTREAFQLMLRTPSAVLSASVLFLAAGFGFHTISMALVSAIGFEASLPLFGFFLVGGAMVCMVLAAIPLRQMAWGEGYLDAVIPTSGQIREMVRCHGRAVLILASLFFMVMLVFKLIPDAPPSDAPARTPETPTLLGLVLSHASGIAWTMFCLAVSTRQVAFCDIAVNNVTARDAFDTAQRRMALVTVGAPLCHVFLVVFFLMLPTHIERSLGSLAVFAFSVFSLFFYYVSSREILGGITGNRRRAMAPQTRTSAAGA